MASLEDRITQQLNPTAAASPDFPEELTANICDLKFEHQLGESDIGTLYHRTWREQPVTIKWIDRINTEMERSQFIREIKVMSHLHNEHIMPFYGASIEDTRLCLLMGVMEKGDLSQILTILSLEERLRMAKDLSLGLSYLHQQSITHGAIKPSNVGINQYNQAKWMNFGLVKTRAISLASVVSTNPDSSWQAPELWQRGRQLTPSSDIYGFGLLLWALMTTRMPYDAISTVRVMHRVGTGFREDIPAELPESIKALIAACWQSDALRRPSAIEVVRTLQAIKIADFGSEQRPVSPSGEELYQQAIDAQGVKNDREARRLYALSSNKGHTKALGSIGLFKLEGKGGEPVNKAAGIACLERAAEGRHLRSMMNLGRIYKKGDTADQTPNYPKALYWYQEALKEEPTNERARQEVALLTQLLAPTDSTYQYVSSQPK